DRHVRDPRTPRRVPEPRRQGTLHRVHVADRDNQGRARGHHRRRAVHRTLRLPRTGPGRERCLFETVLRVSQQTRKLLPEIGVLEDFVRTEHPRRGLARGDDDVRDGWRVVGDDRAFSEPRRVHTSRVDAVPRVRRGLLHVADAPPRVRARGVGEDDRRVQHERQQIPAVREGQRQGRTRRLPLRVLEVVPERLLVLIAAGEEYMPGDVRLAEELILRLAGDLFGEVVGQVAPLHLEFHRVQGPFAEFAAGDDQRPHGLIVVVRVTLAADHQFRRGAAVAAVPVPVPGRAFEVARVVGGAGDATHPFHPLDNRLALAVQLLPAFHQGVTQVAVVFLGGLLGIFHPLELGLDTGHLVQLVLQRGHVRASFGLVTRPARSVRGSPSTGARTGRAGDTGPSALHPRRV